MRAFTLIELLVVIAIIIILMALLFPAFRGAQDSAKRAQSKNELVQIVSAVNAYYAEYGRMPIPPGEAASASAGYTYGDITQGAAHANDWLFNVLRPMNGLTGDQLNENPRLVSFISPPVAKDANPHNGLAPSGSKTGQWCDSWGTPYNIRLDSAYSNSISTNPPYTNAPSWNAVNASAIAWSYGKNQKLGDDSGSVDATASGFDDVLSWQ